ncbi:hypothetical protein ABT404_41900 [Streptomyces hyaluromycini]|uniref:Uncharacterized protein n=1 Tax=Streptomyces hyaluromycini TaxID=1377993 RepID=A0ABV1XA90_9ACTN
MSSADAVAGNARWVPYLQEFSAVPTEVVMVTSTVPVPAAGTTAGESTSDVPP